MPPPQSGPEQRSRFRRGRHRAETDCAASGRCVVQHDGHRDGHDRPCPYRLHSARDDEHLEVVRERDPARAGDEHAQRQRKHTAVTVAVGYTADQRHRHDVAEDVAVDQPRGAVELVLRQTDVIDHCRQHRDDRCLVVRREENAEAREHYEPGLTR